MQVTKWRECNWSTLWFSPQTLDSIPSPSSTHKRHFLHAGMDQARTKVTLPQLTCHPTVPRPSPSTEATYKAANDLAFVRSSIQIFLSVSVCVWSSGTAVATLFACPSVTPWRYPGSDMAFPRNPAMRKVEYDPQNLHLTDIKQFYLNLPEANRCVCQCGAVWFLSFCADSFESDSEQGVCPESS